MKRFIILFIILLLTGCGANTSEDSRSAEGVPEMLEVSILVPETINKNEEITIKARVSQGEELVDDANEVKFEIWKSGLDEHEMLTGIHQGDGIYTTSKSFVDNGSYFIVAHVTARDMHNMPKKEITVGSSETSNEDAKSNEDESHHHAHSHIEIELKVKEPIESNKETVVSAKVQENGEIVSDAIIRFEIWKGNEEKHDYIDASVTDSGYYASNYTFLTQGIYNIKVHVNKGKELHEHIQESIEVK